MDRVLAGKNGTTTTGNRVRDAFQYPELLAVILKIYPANWLDDLRILFVAMVCGVPLDPQKVKAFCQNWLRRFVRSQLGKWHRPSVYVHVLMIHFWKMLEFFPVPIGDLIEEGSEAKNKVFRYDRDHHAQQHDPVANIKDVGLRSHWRADPGTQTFMVTEKSHQPVDEAAVRALFADPEAVLSVPMETE